MPAVDLRTEHLEWPGSSVFVVAPYDVSNDVDELQIVAVLGLGGLVERPGARRHLESEPCLKIVDRAVAAYHSGLEGAEHLCYPSQGRGRSC